MDIISTIVGGALLLLVTFFIVRLTYTIVNNLIKGRKFHHALLQDFNKLRLSQMLQALGISRTAYIHKTRVNDIRQQMKKCSECENTDECDDKLSNNEIDPSKLNFCNNEEDLKAMAAAKQATSQ